MLAQNGNGSGPTLVVGAGISGLSAALFLARQGREVELWESAAHAGGLLAPVPFRGVDCDQGSHRVHRDAEHLLFEITESLAWIVRPRRGKLIFGSHHVAYPPHLWGLLRGLGMRTAMAMAAGFLLRPRAWKSFVAWENDRQHPLTDDEGFERFVTDRVGRSAYEKFYRPYVEKVWGENPSDLSRSVAKQRASMSSPLRALAKGIKVGRSRGASFLYPKHGMTSIVQHLRGQLKKFGVRIRYGRHASLEQLRQTSFSNILYSGQIADLDPDAGFEHRGLYLLHIALPEDVVGPEDTFYAPESRYWFGRVSRPDRFSPSLGRPGETTLCVEIPQGRWGTKRDFQSETEEILSQLLKARILKYPADALETSQVFLPRVYPMYRRGWYRGWLRALSRLNEADARILPIGRQGLFLHCNLDHCVRISADAVDHVSSRRDAASWTERARSYLDLRVRD